MTDNVRKALIPLAILVYVTVYGVYAAIDNPWSPLNGTICLYVLATIYYYYLVKSSTKFVTTCFCMKSVTLLFEFFQFGIHCLVLQLVTNCGMSSFISVYAFIV